MNVVLLVTALVSGSRCTLAAGTAPVQVAIAATGELKSLSICCLLV